MKPASLDYSLIKALFYGAPGTTKTRTAASAVFVEEMWPVLMLESAANPLSIRDYEYRPTILTMESMKDFNYPYDWLRNGQPKDHPFVRGCEQMEVELTFPYKTVIIDGGSEVQRHAFKAVVPGRDANVGDVPPSLERQHFGQILAMMTNWSYKFVQLPMHVVLTCLEQEKQEGANGPIYRRPLIWGQSQVEMSSYVYLVMRLTAAQHLDTRTQAVVAGDIAEVKESHTIGFTKKTASFYAKDQYGMCDEKGELLRFMFDPTMPKIWDAIYK
jgi:hypothetical protein